MPTGAALRLQLNHSIYHNMINAQW